MHKISRHHDSTGSGFDILRLSLSMFILIVHIESIRRAPAAAMLGQQDSGSHAGVLKSIGLAEQGAIFFHTVTPFAVAMFFALSGFLVAGSADRTRSVPIFLSFRLLRIVPALCVEVCLSALVLGPLFTELSLIDYFNDKQFYLYFLNTFGIVTFKLPGVFLGNYGIPGIVNWNLWTLPSEFYCYLFLIILMSTKIFYNKIALTAAAISTSCVVALLSFEGFEIYSNGNFSTLFLINHFALGAALYTWKDRIRLSWWLALIAFSVAFVLKYYDYALFLLAPLIVYFTVTLGMTHVPYPGVLKRNDFSYGIYLYGFPICQALISAFPSLTHSKNLFRISGLVITIIFAAISWIGVERPALKLKSIIARRRSRIA